MQFTTAVIIFIFTLLKWIYTAIASSWLTLMGLAFLQIYQILVRKSISELRPIPILTLVGPLPIITLLQSAYHNFIFNLIYNYVSRGDQSFIKQFFTWHYLKWFILFWVTGIPRFLIIIIKNILLWRFSAGLESFLLQKFATVPTKKQLILVGGVWKANPSVNWPQVFKQLNIDPAHQVAFKPVFNQWVNDVKYICPPKPAIVVSFKANDLRLKQKHLAFYDITNNNTLGLQTDKDTAVVYNNYGKNSVINEYIGLKKKSIILEQDFSEINIKYMCWTSQSHLVVGAWKNGWNNSLISPVFYKQMVNVYDVTEIFCTKIRPYQLVVSTNKPQELNNVIKTLGNYMYN